MKSYKHYTYLLWIIIFCLFSNLSVFGKTQNIDALISKVEQSTKTEKIDALILLSKAYLEHKNWEKAKETSFNAKELAQNLDYNKGLAQAYNILGKVYLQKNDDDNAIKMFYQSLDIYKTIDDKKGIALCNHHIGEVFLIKEEVLKAIEKFREAQTTLENLNDKRNLSHLYKSLGDAYLQKEKPEYGPAKDYYTRSFKLKLELEDYESAAKTARQIADYDINLKDYESAMIYLRSTMETYQGLNDSYNIAEVYHTMGEVYRLQNFPEDAINFYNKALSIRENIKDSIGIADTYKSIGLNHFQLKNNTEASKAFSNSASILKQLAVQKQVPIIYQQISNGFEKLGDTKNSLAYHKKYAETRNIFQNLEKNKAALDIATMYASKFETRELQNKNEQLQLKNNNIKNIRNFLIAVFGLALALLFVAFNSYRRKKKDNQLLSLQNEEIEKKNLEIKEKNDTLDSLNSQLVNEMAERESVEQSSFARDRFLATMSNEMRTPLNIIRGLTHLLLTNEPKEEQIENLRTLQFSANNLVVFINDVLDFSNIEAGKISFDSIDFTPKNTFEEIKERFTLPTKDKGIDLSVDYDSKIPTLLNGDPTRLNQIITNLMNTAIKHTHEGSIQIGVNIHELVDNKLTLLVNVKDTGEGIESEKLETMFRKFSRTAEDMYDGYGNSGLGLAISKRLVDLQNGKIEAHSKIGEGTEFKVYLPYHLVEEKQSNQKETITNYDHLAGNKILIVEDNKINQLVVAKMLKKLNIQVVTADNGQEALDALNEQYFDLILMDIQMPIMDGYRATAEIRKSQDPRVRDLPIIALTASAYLTKKEKAKLFGMDDHVGKPFGPDDLLSKINYHIQLNETVKV